MKKQYCVKEIYGMKATLEIYHDGTLISSERNWEDEIDKKATKLEESGYTYGYSQKAVDNAKKEYEVKLANLIGGSTKKSI